MTCSSLTAMASATGRSAGVGRATRPKENRVNLKRKKEWSWMRNVARVCAATHTTVSASNSVVASHMSKPKPSVKALALSCRHFAQGA